MTYFSDLNGFEETSYFAIILPLHFSEIFSIFRISIFVAISKPFGET